MKNLLLAVAALLLILLLIPLVFNDRSSDMEHFRGPSLADMTYTEISFPNPQTGLKLGGMLLLPQGTETYPMAVFIQGSGSSFRNNSWYLSLAKHLQDNGIAVLLPDKRGSEQSEGDWRGVTIEDLATDTESALRFVQGIDSLRISTLGLVGLSQGGWVAPVAGSSWPELDFIISVSASLTTAEEQLHYEEVHNISAYTYPILAQGIAPLTVRNLRQKPHIAAILPFDPLPYWKKVKTPAFLAYGENDTNCPVESSLHRLSETGLTHLTARVYPEGRHALLNREKTAVSEAFLKDMVEFIVSQK